MGQQRLCNLAFLSIERDTTESNNFEEVIDQFAQIKS